MYARVAAFQNRDPRRVDEVIDIVRERTTGGQDIPEVKRVLMLVHRQAVTARRVRKPRG